MDLPFIGAQRLRASLGMEAAIDALEQAFGSSLATAPDRAHLDTGRGDLLLMPAWSDGAAGVKLVTVTPDNPASGLPLIQGVYVLFEKPSLAPVAVFDAAALTALRTAAVSGLATRYLSREDSRELLIFGAGVQAWSHLEAMRAVRPVERVRVVSRTEARSESLVATAQEMGIDAAVGEADAAGEADIICTCTTSLEPVFDGRLVRGGTHVNAVGSYKPSARELDDHLMKSARVVVDTRTALVESGDLCVPLEEGVISAGEVQDLSAVVSSGGRRGEEEITVFKSVGAAYEDLAVAEALLKAI